MEIELRANSVTPQEVQEYLDEIWRTRHASPELEAALAQIGIAQLEEPDLDSPFSATAGREAFDVGSLILIAAAGRLAASIPERLLVRLFDDVFWPRLKRRFGSGLETKDGEE